MTDIKHTDGENQPRANTNRELWREKEGDYYAPSIHVTATGGIGINVGGHVWVKTLREWHAIANWLAEEASEVDRLRRENESLRRFKASVDEALNSGDGVYRP